MSPGRGEIRRLALANGMEMDAVQARRQAACDHRHLNAVTLLDKGRLADLLPLPIAQRRRYWLARYIRRCCRSGHKAGTKNECKAAHGTLLVQDMRSYALKRAECQCCQAPPRTSSIGLEGSHARLDDWIAAWLRDRHGRLQQGPAGAKSRPDHAPGYCLA